MLHELNYDVKELPTVHLSEQRRLLEGMFAQQKIENDREMARMGQDPEKARMKQESNERALERFKENRDI